MQGFHYWSLSNGFRVSKSSHVRVYFGTRHRPGMLVHCNRDSWIVIVFRGFAIIANANKLARRRRHACVTYCVQTRHLSSARRASTISNFYYSVNREVSRVRRCSVSKQGRWAGRCRRMQKTSVFTEIRAELSTIMLVSLSCLILAYMWLSRWLFLANNK